MINTDKKTDKLSLKEIRAANAAAHDLQTKDRTDQKCPRCNSNLVLNKMLSGYAVSCVACSFKMSVRGI